VGDPQTTFSRRSAQNQEVKPVASGFGARCVLGLSYGTAEAFFTAEELVLSEIAHRGVGAAERVHLAKEVREAGPVRLTNLLESLLVESCGRERLARLLEGREGIDRPSGLREPSDEFDAVELQAPRGLVPVREALSDEDGAPGRRTRRISCAATPRSGMW
jgi:hypothetical protein